MTPKIARFLRDNRPATPCLVLDVDQVERNYLALHQALPLATIHYAVKANPAAPIIERLVGLGSSFDAASFEEISTCLRAGASPDRISYGNTIKKPLAIRAAYEAGVRLFAFDSPEELDKIARCAPGASVYCRILVDNEGADWPLSRKFGTNVEDAHHLMIRARDLGLDASGLSFHVGSQQTDTSAYQAAIGRVARLFTDLRHAGIAIRTVNCGGGFPTQYLHEVPEIGGFASAIMHAMTRHFGNDLPHIVIEPGRFIVGDAGVVSAEVVLVSRRGASEASPRWVYLDIGRFGGLAETEGEAIRYRITTAYSAGRHAAGDESDEYGPVIIAGPTCDGVDVLYEQTPYRLPLALDCGDRVELLATGAYVSTYASQGFNGFPPLTEHYL
jgi:ornithine decarboxylase